MNDLTTHVGTVYPWQCDHNGHLNVMYYVAKFDEATWNLFNRIGITSRYMRGESRGMVAVEQKLEYRRELFPGNVLRIESRLLEVREKIVRLSHTMYEAENGEVVATCEIVGVHLDTSRRRAVPLPPDVRASAAAFV